VLEVHFLLRLRVLVGPEVLRGGDSFSLQTLPLNRIPSKGLDAFRSF